MKSKLYFHSTAALVAILLMSHSTFAQVDEGRLPVPQPPDWSLNPVVYLTAFVFIVLVIAVLVLFNINVKLIKSISPNAFEKRSAQSEYTDRQEQAPGLLRKIYLRLVDSVPVAKEKDILLDHDYDGIKELDNNLPPWWKYGFYVTILFAFFYLIGYHVTGTGKLQLAEYSDELLLAQKQKEERLKNLTDNVNEDNVTILHETTAVSSGKETYEKFCAACHLVTGGGQVGPNLTDDNWLHGGGIRNIFKTITYGVPGKGMISWKSQLSPKQIQQVASYILTLHGTNPPDAKEPQGEKWVEETVIADSSAVASAVKPDTIPVK
jgi:cytochrome c oxidase cbb3-type subunit 3